MYWNGAGHHDTVDTKFGVFLGGVKKDEGLTRMRPR
jgi:hypothetical protein